MKDIEITNPDHRLSVAVESACIDGVDMADDIMVEVMDELRNRVAKVIGIEGEADLDSLEDKNLTDEQLKKLVITAITGMAVASARIRNLLVEKKDHHRELMRKMFPSICVEEFSVLVQIHADSDDGLPNRSTVRVIGPDSGVMQ